MNFGKVKLQNERPQGATPENSLRLHSGMKFFVTPASNLGRRLRHCFRLDLHHETRVRQTGNQQ
jgi:hypothetical protein